MSELRKFTCQQCKYHAALDTVFNFEVCPKCGGNLFPDDYVPPVDWKARAEIAEAENRNYQNIFDLQKANIEQLKSDANTLAELLSDSLKNDEPRTAPEDIEVEALCVRLGFGAVLSSAARLWARRDDNAAFTLGTCRALVRSALANHEIAKGGEG